MRQQIDREVRAFEPEGVLLVRFEPSLDIEELRYLCERALERDDVATCAALSNVEGDAGRIAYVIAADETDLRPACKELNHRLGGRGGGKPQMVQGSWATSREDAEAAIKDVLG